MQEEEIRYVEIIKDSQKKLGTLELLSNFFNHRDIYGSLIKTKIIHNLFQSNRNLDINKLELFHIQYTTSLIDLLRKLKKSKEHQYGLISDEIYINEDFVSKLALELGASKFNEQIIVHAQQMSKKIGQLYRMLVDDKVDNFTWNELVNFSNSVQAEYYRPITGEKYQQLTTLNRSTYQNTFARFERKLMGRLNILQFKIKFKCGLVYNNEIIEVYEFRDSNDRFIFVVKDKSFYFLTDAEAAGLDLSKNTAARQELIHQLSIKNAHLKEQLATIKTTLPENVKEVLKSYLEKISGVDLVNNLQNVDEQTNILKTMLNIQIN